ncbi:alpha-L-fucosidase [Lederbergia wuyishanensis]|uniref:alpha-L-fucosidase n=1 Tax=Lederbergia wuyishanensis TaxID=1347903 RepID=A0ABU0D432_9BACI|nr:alpha-L-fucosidase [Lederbergia wuyishanensis]MCJ8008247.1 alpha-L-fucosidase [Lederbergia wuyishanensis]MDQ0343164.1 alpha-L-fucosidase [Lederbergia wuyishanensis]
MKTTNLAIPTKAQLAWQDLDLGIFCHFGINTFCDQEWGEGTDSPELFNPTELDAAQWVKLAKDAGFKYFVLTAKHHDGFCLWPTATTDYSVKSSPWKDGKGDVVRECAEACKNEGIHFGLYLSPWDRHEPCYEDAEAYDDFYSEQLTELLTQYGPIMEVWFDGAGSEGREYNWERMIGIVKKYQPDAMIFNMGQPTIRWVGNEEGVAPYPCWNTESAAKISMFSDEKVKWLPGTPEWLPAECDVPIRKLHWFWHPNDEESLRSLDDLMHIYYNSVGHGTNLLLNLSPDNRGLIPEIDAKRLLEFGAEIKRRFSNSLGSVSGTGTELELLLENESTIDHIVLMEDIAFGERVRKFEVSAFIDGEWKIVLEGSAIGHRYIKQIPSITTTKLKLFVVESVETPLIREFSCYIAGKG